MMAVDPMFNELNATTDKISSLASNQGIFGQKMSESYSPSLNQSRCFSFGRKQDMSSFIRFTTGT